MRVTLRPTVAADLPFLIDRPLPHRIQAITALAGDKVIGIGGIGFLPDGTVLAFVEMAPEARKYPVAIHRAGLMAMDMIRRSRAQVVVAETSLADLGERWLVRLGFAPVEVGGARAFVWEKSRDGRTD